MFVSIVHHLQQLACIWLAVSVLYSTARKSLNAARQYNAADPYRALEPIAHSSQAGILPAAAALVLTLADIFLSLA